MREITINGKSHELSFGNNFYRKLETEHGIAMTEIEMLIKKKPVDTFIKMMFVSMAEGARLGKMNFTMSIDDVADLTDTEDGVFEKFSELLQEVAQKKTKVK
jgi:hypothetical protein